jgi:hypothetical protein
MYWDMCVLMLTHLNIYVLTNVTNSCNESSRVDYCIGNIFNVNSLMIITKHPVLHTQFFNWACIPEDGQFWLKRVKKKYCIHMSTSLHTYLNISIVNVFIYYLMFATTALKMEAMVTNANGMLQYRFIIIVEMNNTVIWNPSSCYP